MRVRAGLAMALLSAGLGACSDGPSGGDGAARLEVVPRELVLLEKEEYPLEVRALDAAGRAYQGPMKLAWSTADASVAQVSEEGVVRGILRGETRVIATSGRARGEALVRVVSADSYHMRIDGAPASMHPGEAAYLRVQVAGPGQGPLPLDRLVWSVSDPAVLEIHPREVGVDVVALGVGQATVRAALGRLQDEVEINVVSDVGRIELWPSSVRALVGEAVMVDARIYDRKGKPMLAVAEWSHEPQGALEPLDDPSLPSMQRRYVVRRTGEIRVRAAFHGLVAETVIQGEAVGPFESLQNWKWGLCGLTKQGAIHCFGERPGGPLPVAELRPYHLETHLRLVALSVGVDHLCGLTADGRAYCLGDNDEGELGDGTLIDRTIFTRVQTEVQFREIHAGASYTCAISTEPVGDNAYCWGQGASGKLGTGSVENQVVPTPIQGHRFQTLAVSRTPYNGASTTCGIDDEGRVLCWGANDSGQLGNGTRWESSVPVPVSSDASHVAVAVVAQAWSANDVQLSRHGHACALTSLGEIRCWGNNSSGQVRLPESVEPVPLPVGVAPGPFVGVVVAGQEDHGVSCGIDVDGVTLCWGSPTHGLVFGFEAMSRSHAMAAVGAGTRFRALDVWNDRTCGIDLEGRAYCWGQLPDPSTGSGFRLYPEPVCLPRQDC